MTIFKYASYRPSNQQKQKKRILKCAKHNNGNSALIAVYQMKIVVITCNESFVNIDNIVVMLSRHPNTLFIKTSQHSVYQDIPTQCLSRHPNTLFIKTSQHSVYQGCLKKNTQQRCTIEKNAE